MRAPYSPMGIAASITVLLIVQSHPALASEVTAGMQSAESSGAARAAEAPSEIRRAAQQADTFKSCLTNIPGSPLIRLPGSPDYRTYANGLRIIRWQFPAAVIYAESAAQVQAAVLCATKFRVQPIPRAGGNSFEALSSGNGSLVIDLTKMSAVTVDVGQMTATIQGGARIGNVYVAIAKAGYQYGKNLTCLGGVWPQVGFGGLMAAGGYSSMSRKYGVLADHIVGAKVVDARGRLLQADAHTHPDLFFAVRGGGGGTYGIVVEATVKVIEVPVVTLAHIGYSKMTHAVDILDRFQRWGPQAPPELTFTYNFVRAGSDIKLYYLGHEQQLKKLVDESGLASYPGAVYRSIECSSLGSRGWLAGSGWSPLVCQDNNLALPQTVYPNSPLLKDREASKYRSAVFKQLIPRKGLQAIVDLVQAPGKVWKLFQFKAYGGAFDEVLSDFDSFPHRKGTIMHCEFGTSFGYQKAANEINRALADEIWAYFRQAEAVMDEYGSGGRYNGYVCLDDRPEQYFVGNYDRLRRIKERYDPGNVFRNALSVPPADVSVATERGLAYSG